MKTFQRILIPLFLFAFVVQLPLALLSQNNEIRWRQVHDQPAAWYNSAEAIRIADNLLLYQHDNGGWYKNIDMARPLSKAEREKLEKQKSQEMGTTIDNGATHSQMRFLAKVYSATNFDRFETAFMNGLDYLLEARYENGGWPQYYPLREGYYSHITFNDGAMIGVMSLFRDIEQGAAAYRFVDPMYKEKCRKANEKAIALILDMQVVVNGQPTVWCAQHDEFDLSPAKARAYELPSLSGGESVGVVKFLMGIENPDYRVVRAIEYAVAWYQRSNIEGKEVKWVKDASYPRGRDRVVIDNPDASPLWARFYDIESNQPMFVGRDGIAHDRFSEIEHERRVGYSYLSNYGEDLLEKAYPQWLERISGSGKKVALYRVFETSLINKKPYENRFTNVDLLVQYQAPSGRVVDFMGFYDGNADGSGSFAEGAAWKMRFMPDEPGLWNYVYRWSDGTPGGHGSFYCTTQNAGKGIIKPYKKNPYWFAYNGNEPVYLKSYYETGHGSLGQDFDWLTKNVYQKLLDNDYNHLQVNWLLSLCCFGQYYQDGPEPETLDLALFSDENITETMNLAVWQRMEQHMNWLNERNVGVHMFLGVDGSRNDGPEWENLNDEERDFYVKYMVARLAPYANLAGWNFVWEVPGDREDFELAYMRLIKKYDVFDHLTTYEDECPRENFYHLPEYSFAAVENHRIVFEDKSLERKHLWREPWTHHVACLLGYRGKPVFMSEGNALWRRYWHQRSGADQDDLRRAAWACATAGASFTWNGHASEYELVAGGPDGLPFNDENEFTRSERYVSILSETMQNEIDFHRMQPDDALLSECEALRVYALAEPGKQYLVFAMDGEPFTLQLKEGTYTKAFWLNTESGEMKAFSEIGQLNNVEAFRFNPPDRISDWALIIR
ncbi:pectate lyase [Roseimarinus sediminis]|uniref:pectate lyase n=1 Tax=Roseimarinus sediminis TaxID=1610899 RepID=UPI003D23989E